MKLKLLTMSLLAATLIGCGSDRDPIPTAPQTAAPLQTPAVLSSLSGVISNDETEMTGAVTVFDIDAGDSTITPLTDANGAYGTFSIGADGSWTYTLDASNSAVAGLATPNDKLTDEFDITSHDGTAATVTITISGVGDPNVVTTQVARIGDPGDDTGELRYRLGGAIQGKVTALFNKEHITGLKDGTEDVKDAYLTLYSSTSGSGNDVVTDLRIQEDRFIVRHQDDLVIDVPFKVGEWQSVEVSWVAPDENTPPMVTILVDGEILGEPHQSVDSALGGVNHVAFRVSDNSAVINNNAYYYVDDIKIYNDAEGTDLLFEDDFEGYEIGAELGTAQGYDGNSAYADVAAIPAPGSSGGGSGGGSGSGAGNATQFAQISDTIDTDSGELRYALGSGFLKGKLTAIFMKDDNAIDQNDAAKDAYVTLFNESTSTSSGRAIADLRIHSDSFELRDQADITVANAFTPGAWQTVEMTWDAATSGTPPMVTVKIDGVAVTTEPFSAPDAALGGVTHIAFRFADNGAIVPADINFHVDDIKIYSDVEGTALEFEDDFEGYSVGDSLDGTPYHNNTSEAVVAVE